MPCRLRTAFTTWALAAATALASARAQTAPAIDPWRPDPREIPLPRIDTGRPPRPGPTDLPARPDLPDVLTFNNGAPVTRAAWPQRQAELRDLLSHYFVGHVPPPPAPGDVRGEELRSAVLHNGKVNYRLVRLAFGPDHALSLHIGIYTPIQPAGSSPVPAIVEIGWNTPPGATVLPRLPHGPTQGRGTDALLVVGGGIPASQPAGTGALGIPPGQTVPLDVAERFAASSPVLARGYAFVTFNYTDCGEDTTLRNPDGSWAYRTTRFFPAYPNHDWGLVGAWAWGASRAADFLQADPAIDPAKLIVTGFSRCGKAAFVAGAFDPRFALTAPASSSGAGTPAFRFSGADRGGNEGLTEMVRKYPNWFSPHLHPFWGQPDKLPFDQHFLIALCAPRAFLALEGLQDRNVNQLGVQKSFEGARPVFDLLDARDRLGVNWLDRPHAMLPADWEALVTFADKTLLGKTVPQRFDAFPPLSTPRAPVSPVR